MSGILERVESARDWARESGKILVQMQGAISGVRAKGDIDFVSDVTYDTGDQCLKYTTTRVHGFFANSGGSSGFGVAQSPDTNITCAQECD